MDVDGRFGIRGFATISFTSALFIASLSAPRSSFGRLLHTKNHSQSWLLERAASRSFAPRLGPSHFYAVLEFELA
jgi:hypothetical protein